MAYPFLFRFHTLSLPFCSSPLKRGGHSSAVVVIEKKYETNRLVDGFKSDNVAQRRRRYTKFTEFDE